MIKGLYAAASAMLARMNQQSLLAHNVSNLDTPGFKQVLSSLEDFYQVPVNQPPAEASLDGRTRPVGLLGLGVEPAPNLTDFSEGAMQFTGEPLDFAIHGAGFFRVSTPSGERYTRDGRFRLDANRNLVTVDGYFVLDQNGQAITLPDDGPVTLGGDGALFVNGRQAAQLGLASFANPAAELTRDLPNAFAASAAPSGQERGALVQGYLEGANADPAQLMTQMVMVARNYEAAQQMVQNEDELLGRAINSLGSW